MRLIDLTLSVPDLEQGRTMRTEEWRIDVGQAPYTARVHEFNHSSMAGTYIDFPSHIRETDDGSEASGYAIDKLYRVPADVVHLDRCDGSGGIGAAELEATAPSGNSPALVLNALGSRRFDDIEERSVWLTADAASWIVSRGVRLLVSDVYESNTDPQDVFPKFFRGGVATVCAPVNLHLLDRPRARITALPLRFGGATQAPCRLIAEIEE